MVAQHSIRHELYRHAAQVCAALAPPPISSALLVDPQPDPSRDAEFGLLALSDGSAGLYYAWLGGEQARLPERFSAADLEGVPALEVAALYLADSDIERSLGLAAINALTAHLYRRAGYTPPACDDSMAGITVAPGLRLGFVGNFPPLVRRARQAGATVAVVERKARMVTREPGLEISLDPAVLLPCEHILCTGATLLNDSFESMLPWCANARSLTLVGPTVGFFPDAVFARGVAAVAGTRIVDVARARARLASGTQLGDAAVRTLIRRDDYPGFAALLARAQAR